MANSRTTTRNAATQAGDIILGSSLEEEFDGLGGDDVTLMGGGTDEGSGGAGNDVLAGGSGDDLLTGGAVAYVFIYREDLDTITDFVSGQDRVRLDLDLPEDFDVLANLRQTGDDVVLQIGEYSLTFLDQTVANFREGDFLI